MSSEGRSSFSSSAIQSAVNWNGLTWEIGNGLAKTTVITYLAFELGAGGTIVGLILAAPHLVGVVRLAVPTLLRLYPHLSRLAVGGLLLSCIPLAAIPVMVGMELFPTGSSTLIAISIAWGLWHLILYAAVIALLSWFRVLVPVDQIGQFLGRRERWKMAGVIIGALMAGGFAWLWNETHPAQSRWWAYAISTFYGAVVMFGSNYFLANLPSVSQPPEEPLASDDRSTKPLSFFSWWHSCPLQNGSFFWFLVFACWGAFANGVTQAAVGLFAPVALRLPVLAILVLESVMRLGQSAAAPLVGRWIDRHGSRGTLVLSQLLIAVSLVFYFPASREVPYWILGVYLMWIAYVGLNVGLFRTVLNLAPKSQAPHYLAWYQAATGLAVGVGAILGGTCFELLPRSGSWRWEPWSGVSLSRFELFFVIGLVLRASAVWPLWNWREGSEPKLIVEPDGAE